MNHALINILLQAISDSDLQQKDYVVISKKEAEDIVRALGGQPGQRWNPTDQNGKVLFYCSNCSKSFWADSEEDPEYYKKWHYRIWHATCPTCKKEVTQTDRYWR